MESTIGLAFIALAIFIYSCLKTLSNAIVNQLLILIDHMQEMPKLHLTTTANMLHNQDKKIAELKEQLSAIILKLENK